MHLLRKWLNLNKETSFSLEKLSGVNAQTIRHICRYGTASKEKFVKLSEATGIRPEVLMFPERYPGFDISKCKADNIEANINC